MIVIPPRANWSYEDKRQFFQNLTQAQRDSLMEAEEAHETSVLFALRYLALNDQGVSVPSPSRASQAEVARAFGLAPDGAGLAARVYGVASYLDETLRVGVAAQQVARGLRERARLRVVGTQLAQKQRVRAAQATLKDARVREILRDANIHTAPRGLTSGLVQAYIQWCRAGVASRLRLAQNDKRDLEVIRLRLGVIDGVVRSLAKIGRDYGISREAVRKIFNRAMERLTTTCAGRTS